MTRVVDSLPITQGDLLTFPRDPLGCMKGLHHTHGPIGALEDGGHRLVFVFSPEFNRQVLTDTECFHSRFFALRGPKHSAQRRLSGALLTMNGDEHKRHRRIVSGPFQKQSIIGYRDAVVGLLQDMLGRWRAGEVRDVRQDMTQYLLRVTSSLLFGYDVPESAYEIGRRTDHWAKLNHELGMGAFVSDPGITAGYGDLLHVADDLEEQIRAMIEYRRSSGRLGSDVLSLLLRAQEESEKGLTDAEVIGQTAVLFGAAHLTTAFSLMWMLFLLAQHPGVAASLAAELKGVLGGSPPTVSQLEELPLLERVVKESMRVLPASAYSQRIVMEPVELGPFFLTKGTAVIFSQFMTHHLASLYPEPEHFRPERWLTLRPSPYAYLPFGAGPRMCLGGPLALQTIKLAVATMLQQFHFQIVPDSAINARVTSTMLGPTGPIPMRVLPPDAPFRRSRVTGNIHELVVLE